MTLRLSTGARTSLLGSSGFKDLFDTGVIEIRSGAQPASPDDAASGTLLGTVTLNSGAFTPGVSTNGLTFGTPADGEVAKSGVWSFNGVADGTAGWFRLKGNGTDAGSSSTSLPRMDGTIGTSGADLNLSNLSIVTSGPNTIDTFTVTLPLQ